MEHAGAMTDRVRRILPLLIFGAALVVRMAYFLEARSGYWYAHPRLDALFHDRWAQSIAAGNLAGDTVFFRAPLYPYFLGLLYALGGHDYDVPRLAQHLMGMLLVAAVFFYARRLFGFGAAVIAALLVALSPVLVFFEGELLFESFLAALCLFWLARVDRTIDTPRPLRHLVSGFLFGLICITRPLFLALAPLLLFWIACRILRMHGSRAAAVAAGSLAAGIVIAVAPVTIRNALVGGDPVLIASQGGVNFYIGNNPSADGATSSLPPFGSFWTLNDQSAVVERALGRRASASEESSYWYRQGERFVLEQPGAFLSLLGRKIMLFWNVREIPNNRSFDEATADSRVLSRLPVRFSLLGALGLAGMVIAVVQRRARLLAVFILATCAVTVMFFVNARFRVPVLPPLAIFSGFAVMELARLFASRDFKRLAGTALVVLGAAVVVQWPLRAVPGRDPAREEFVRGLSLLGDGEHREAETHFRAAAAVHILPNLYASWGRAAWQGGDTAEAMRLFRRELVAFPESAPTLANLSFISLARGKPDDAYNLAQRSVVSSPLSQAGYIAAAQALQQMHRDADAESVLNSARMKVRGFFPFAEYLLATLQLKRTRDVAAAESAYASQLRKLERPRQTLFEPELDFGMSPAARVDDPMLRARLEYRLAHIGVARGDLLGALDRFNRALEADSTFADAWADCGIARLQLGRPREAESCLVRATRLDTSAYLYWYNLGTARKALGDSTGAVDALRRCLALAPGFTAARDQILFLTGEHGG